MPFSECPVDQHVWMHRVSVRGQRVCFDIVCRICGAVGQEEQKDA